MSEADEVWQRVDANKRVAQEYLTEHELHYPTWLKLPVAVWHESREPIKLVPEGEPRCESRAREEMSTGMAYGPGLYDFVEVRCALPPGHAGDHVSSCVRYFLKRKWNIVSWGEEA